jgi:phosphoglycolate phosphatase-like HAD superfamily hydrolase
MTYLPNDETKLIIFDKDGTLIDFNTMWISWVVELARRLEAAKLSIGHEELRNIPSQHKQFSFTDNLFRTMGVDVAAGRVLPGSHLALDPMAELRALTVQFLQDAGLAPEQAEQAVAGAWFIPDPVALARPLADLPALFGALRARGLRIAVATTDDRAPTLATLTALGVAPLVDALACGDDGRPIKPAPDAILALCRKLGIAPAQAAMVGDTAADLRMGRAAGVGLTVGVLSGVGSAELLAPLADVLLPSVADLLSATAIVDY